MVLGWRWEVCEVRGSVEGPHALPVHPPQVTSQAPPQLPRRRASPPPHPAPRRQRLEYLKKRRRNWEMVYARVTRADALCTLSVIEEANARVEELLSEESRERNSVSGGWVGGCWGVGVGGVAWRGGWVGGRAGG